MEASPNHPATGKDVRDPRISRASESHAPVSPGRAMDIEVARRDAFHRMEAQFPTNRGLAPLFLMMANAHRCAIDYIEQAPAIVAVVTRGTTHVSLSERAFFQEQLASLCERGARLRDVMQCFGLPLPLRRLEAGVLTASRATAIRRLALLNPSTLAQIIPASRQKQNAWLQALEHWCRSMAHRLEGQNERCPFFEWAAINLAGITFREAGTVSYLVDYVAANLGSFNPAWTLARARRAEQAWHEELALVDLADRPDIDPSNIIDYGSLPQLWERDGYRFVALQTGKALHREGAAMRHCVASYWHNVIAGRSRIYSVQQDGNRVATLELCDGVENYRWGRSSFRIRQLVGMRNARPAPEVAVAAAAFVRHVNET